MKKTYIILVIIVMLFINTMSVNANIICNDGVESPTCQDCHQGCCSWHGGCVRDNGTETGDSGNVVTTLLVAGGAAAGAYAYGKKKREQ